MFTYWMVLLNVLQIRLSLNILLYWATFCYMCLPVGAGTSVGSRDAVSVEAGVYSVNIF